jgi:preprotein translocase SecE subunit
MVTSKRWSLKRGWIALALFIGEVRREVQRVTWPVRGEVISITWVVFGMVAIFATFFLIVDAFFAKIVWLILA